ncbi:hypothetical protein EOD42_11295 [Rhodovarius crocodyli]|uniref:BPL/LPL catalytic domain-containing protein n=1 Tax=Rhodovarius crocodyli TaxID=1979269 RepID=A0A437MH53_9PROT|nr:biotin/lipoate--protein ligase family protein [Rhodovarius crocodyli]RVT96973.1 hypothetical protein EOD42_11295 [Rhodovarius crocodyli]
MLQLPSLFRPVPLREGQDAMRAAVELAPEEGAPAPSRGAGTLCFVRAAGRVEAAVVLEPDMPLRQARIARHVAANALADALVVLGPPELPVELRWDGTVVLNSGAVGRLHLAAAPAAEDEVPEWLVVGFTCRLAFPPGHESGLLPGETALSEEGYEDVDAEAVTDAWARHFLSGLDEWQARGPDRAFRNLMARLLDHAGEKRGIDPATGGLVLERDGVREIFPL